MRNKKLNDEFQSIPEEQLVPETEEKKTSKNKLINAINFINGKYDFRYNVINTDYEYKLKSEKDYRYFDDRDYRDVMRDLKLRANITLTKLDYELLVYGSEIGKTYNPFTTYLNSLPNWDGEDYMSLFLKQIELKDENEREYFVNGFKKWFVALVMSLVTEDPCPENVNQVCLVLVGDQGIYKTTFLKSIVPAHLQLKYFYGSTFQIHNKDHEKFLAYKILINLDEMAALNKTDIESMKSRITQDQVVVRLPYGRADVHLKRRASFCGNVNNAEYLRDDTGTRRFFTIEVSNIKLDKSFDIDSMYAQALALYRSGFQYWFDKEETKKVESHNVIYTQNSMEEQKLLKLYQLPTEEDFQNNTVQFVTATDIAEYFREKDNGMNINNTVIKNIGAVLKKNGFVKKFRKINNHATPRPLWAVKKVFEPQNYDPEEEFHVSREVEMTI